MTPIDKTPWILNLILTVLFDPLWQGVNRIWRNRSDAVMVLVGILWILTLGLFIVGWIIDIVDIAVHKSIKLFA